MKGHPIIPHVSPTYHSFSVLKYRNPKDGTQKGDRRRIERRGSRYAHRHTSREVPDGAANRRGRRSQRVCEGMVVAQAAQLRARWFAPWAAAEVGVAAMAQSSKGWDQHRGLCPSTTALAASPLRFALPWGGPLVSDSSSRLCACIGGSLGIRKEACLLVPSE